KGGDVSARSTEWTSVSRFRIDLLMKTLWLYEPPTRPLPTIARPRSRPPTPFAGAGLARQRYRQLGWQGLSCAGRRRRALVEKLVSQLPRREVPRADREALQVQQVALVSRPAAIRRQAGGE